MPNPIHRPLQIQVHTPRPKLARRVLQLEDLGGLRPEDLAALLPLVLMNIATFSVRRRCATSLLGCSGSCYLLEMVDMRLQAVDVAEDRSPMGGELL